MDKKCVLVVNRELDFCRKEFPSRYQEFAEKFTIISQDDFRSNGCVIIDENNTIQTIDSKNNYSLVKSKYQPNAYITLRNYQNNERAIVSKLAIWMGAVWFDRKSKDTTSSADSQSADLGANFGAGLNLGGKSSTLGANLNTHHLHQNNSCDKHESSLCFEADGSARKTKEEFRKSLELENIDYRLLDAEFVNLIENYLANGSTGVSSFKYDFKIDMKVEETIKFMLNYDIKADVFGKINVEHGLKFNRSKENNQRKIIDETYEIRFVK